MSEPLIVDANPLMSTLLGGRAEKITSSGAFKLYSTQFTLFEVAKYIPRLAEKLGSTELELFAAFEELPVVACQPSEYADREGEAAALIGARDERDVPLLAPALTRGYSVWSDDRDFEGIAEIQLYKTSDLIAQLFEKS